MERALLAREDDRMHDRPEPEHDPAGARHVGALATAGEPQARAEADRRERQQPGDLPADLRVEQTPQTRQAAEARARAGALAREPPEAVVAEDQVPDGAVGRAADVRRRARPQRDGDRPRSRDDDHDHAGERELAYADRQPRRAG